MNLSGYRYVSRYFQWALIAVLTSALFSPARGTEAVTETLESPPASATQVSESQVPGPEGSNPQDSNSQDPNRQGSEDSRPGPLGLRIVGASAGITTDYFEQAVVDALVDSDIFSDIDPSTAAETVLPMIRAKGVFPGTVEIDNTPYFLDIRIVKLDTPTFSVYMTVGMNVIWTLYRTDQKAEILHENIYSTYTGGMFEGGIHGANRVRVATEGATRENVRMGIEILEVLDFEQELQQESEPSESEQE